MNSRYAIVQFDEDEIRSFEEQEVAFKARYDYGARWIGRVGEEAFRRLMDRYKVAYTDLTNIGPSWIDFVVGRLRIDVKTVGATTPIVHEWYACNFDKGQYDQMCQADKEKQPNTFVFCRYYGNQVKFVGVKSKRLFDIDKVEIPKGVKITDTYTVKEDQYEVLIKQCGTIEEFINYYFRHI